MTNVSISNFKNYILTFTLCYICRCCLAGKSLSRADITRVLVRLRLVKAQRTDLALLGPILKSNCSVACRAVSCADFKCSHYQVSEYGTIILTLPFLLFENENTHNKFGIDKIFFMRNITSLSKILSLLP